MILQRLELKNFRCFKSAIFDISSPVTIIQGNNGSGKTSLLEALHYGCHLRSFRTHIPLDLIADKSDPSHGFHMQLSTAQDEISLGVSSHKRSLKINGKNTTSYSDLIKSYKVVTFIEDDLSFIKGYPEIRRAFLDQALALKHEHYYALLRAGKKTIDQRNHVLQHIPFSNSLYQLWTEQLIESHNTIVALRQDYIKELNQAIKQVSSHYGTPDFLSLEYLPKRIVDASDNTFSGLLKDELRAQRTLFGYHLDDLSCRVYNRNSRLFASRGQQKLALMILKIAQALLLKEEKNQLVFLIDDFLTDFDSTRIKNVISLLLDLKVQLIITVPDQHAQLYRLCQEYTQVSVITLPDHPAPSFQAE